MPRGRQVYRLAWVYLWLSVAAVGSGVAVTSFGWVTTVTAALISAALACGAYCTSNKRIKARQHRRLIMTVSVGSLTGVGLAGWLYSVGPAAASLPIAALVTSPALLGRLDRRLSHCQWRGPLPAGSGPANALSAVPAERDHRDDQLEEPRDATSPPVADTPPVLVQSLSDEHLCGAWRTSFVALERLLAEGDTAQQALMVSRRQQYLDELERRHPDGVAQWLLSGAHPGSDPAPYIVSPPRRPRQSRT